MKTVTDQFIENLRREIEQHRIGMKKWRDKFEKDPAYALAWAHEITRDAADLDLYLRVAGTDGSTDLRKLHAWLQDQVLRGAMYPSRSTSPMANVMDQESLSAKARLLERVESALERATS